MDIDEIGNQFNPYCLHRISSLKTIYRDSEYIDAFYDHIADEGFRKSNHYTFISFSDLFSFYQNESLVGEKIKDFSELSDKEKDFFFVIYNTTDYFEFLAFDLVRFVKQTKGQEQGILKWFDVKRKYQEDNGIVIKFDDRKYLELRRGDSVSDPLNPYYGGDMSTVRTLSVPSLKITFEHLTQIKKTFRHCIGIFYNIFGQISKPIITFNTYNSLLESVLYDDFEQFKTVVLDFDDDTIRQLFTIIEQVYPTACFIEYYCTNYRDDLLLSSKNDLLSSSFRGLPAKKITHFPYESTLISFIFSIVFIHILKASHFLRYMSEYEYECIKMYWISKGSNGYRFNNWVFKEAEEILINFKNYPHNYMSESLGTNQPITKMDYATATNDENAPQVNLGSRQKQSSGSNTKESGKSELPKKAEPKAEAPRHIEVPCSKEMLTKLAEGLVQGIDDESKPLVTSKVKERNSTIIKKLVCLFSGVGIHDESLEWPYNLEWTDYANSLKLLVYLLNYEGELKDPLDAVDENDKEGIAKEIKQDFSGIPFWRIVGPALDYSERSLSSKAKIPVKNNVVLMKKLAQFWYECKKLDD